MKTRKSTLFLSATALILILVAYGLGYNRGFKARGPVVHFERETSEVAARAPNKTGYEPYFTKVNEIPKEPK